MRQHVLARFVTFGLVFWGILGVAVGYFAKLNVLIVGGVVFVAVALAVNTAWGQ